jgi:FkbM family methyltransferase
MFVKIAEPVFRDGILVRFMLKNSIRKILNALHIDLSQNLKYDRLSKSIIRKVLADGTNAIDIGCHKGEILDIFLQSSPTGNHFGFEPIPGLYQHLTERYSDRCRIFPFALSNSSGTTPFQHVKNASAYSGIRKREYNIPSPEISEIIVETRRLDDVIPEGVTVRFIKIDVEGGEFDVLKGAEKLLKRDKPYILFEFGLGASDYYGTRPEDLFAFLTATGMKIATLHGWLKREDPLSQELLSRLYFEKSEYYFLAYPADSQQ